MSSVQTSTDTAHARCGLLKAAAAAAEAVAAAVSLVAVVAVAIFAATTSSHARFYLAFGGRTSQMHICWIPLRPSFVLSARNQGDCHGSNRFAKFDIQVGAHQPPHRPDPRL